VKGTLSWRLFALSGFLAVAFGAFGAHALQHRLDEKALSVYQTAVSYHFSHTLAWGIVCTLGLWRPSPWLRRAGVFFGMGIALFSGSLYALALTGISGLGAITPLGGVSFLAGWVMVALAGRDMLRAV
jgi:uncharacterized membrane protein YgdD (TMEM256/DUF423 family)